MTTRYQPIPGYAQPSGSDPDLRRARRRERPSSSFPQDWMPSGSSGSSGFLEVVGDLVAAALFRESYRRVYPVSRRRSNLVWPWLSTPSVEDLLVELPASGVSLGGADPHWDCYCEDRGLSIVRVYWR